MIALSPAIRVSCRLASSIASPSRRRRLAPPLSFPLVTSVIRLLLFVFIAATVSSCGGSSQSDSGPRYSEQQIAAALRDFNVVPADESDGTESCVASAILNTPQEVELYVDAGDPVATTEDRNAGVKVTAVEGREAACLDAARQALASLTDG